MRSGLLLALLVSARPTFSPCRDQPALVPQRVIRQVFSAPGRESDLADGWDRFSRGVYWRMVQNLARRLTRLARAATVRHGLHGAAMRWSSSWVGTRGNRLSTCADLAGARSATGQTSARRNAITR